VGTDQNIKEHPKEMSKWCKFSWKSSGS